MERIRGPVVGVAAWGLLVVLACAVPLLTGWDVKTALYPDLPVPPLHAEWVPQASLLPTSGAVVLAAAGCWWGQGLAVRLPWGRLLLLVYVAGLVFMLLLALTAGPEVGLGRLGHRSEYLVPARSITSWAEVHTLLGEYVDRIPYSAAPDNWPIHLAGHPPGALLVYVALVQVGLGGDVVAGVVTAAIGATTALAVLVTLRRLGAEMHARTVAPFLVLGPAALWFAASADGVFAAVGAWGLALLACSATAASRGRTLGWGVLAGLLLGSACLLSYGLPLLGTIALAILWTARSWWPLPVAALAALVVVLGFAVAGFAWWEAYPVLHDRYWAGIAKDRPAAYWLWGNLAALAVCAGPALGAALGSLRRGADRVVVALVGGALAAIVLADVSRMSKAEAERIWLPFVPWLLVATALLPERWRRPALVAQVVVAIAVELLLDTSW